MGAVADRFSVQEAVIRAIAAGADVALIKRLPDPDALLTAMEAAVGDGRLPPARVDDALARVLLRKGCV